MPSARTFPASGVNTIASAQVLLRRDLIVRNEVGPFGPVAGSTPAATRAANLRVATTLNVTSLRTIFVSLFLFPTYTEGGITYPARNTLTWRPVYRMPADSFPNTSAVATESWLPFCAPMILPVGLPINFELPVGGAQLLAVEIEAPVPANGVTHQERVLFNLSAGA